MSPRPPRRRDEGGPTPERGRGGPRGRGEWRSPDRREPPPRPRGEGPPRDGPDRFAPNAGGSERRGGAGRRGAGFGGAGAGGARTGGGFKRPFGSGEGGRGGGFRGSGGFRGGRAGGPGGHAGSPGGHAGSLGGHGGPPPWPTPARETRRPDAESSSGGEPGAAEERNPPSDAERGGGPIGHRPQRPRPPAFQGPRDGAARGPGRRPPPGIREGHGVRGALPGRPPGPPSSHRSPFEGRPRARVAPPVEALAEGEELIAGRRPVEEAFAAGRHALRLLVTPQRRPALEKLVLHATTLRIPIVEVEGGSLTSLAGFDGHQGVALVVDARRFASLDEILARAIERAEPPFVLA
ncbi:MAG TPA: RNA methyltransferase substrate-binding domain-containing protein, partial [Candidatus Limnocylindrales bacterium]|nr:RNA methyltransferase substrate-binding domain-containing protein [Candidatus Limnocylindrales bacterium]